jgi:hypothetical protein
VRKDISPDEVTNINVYSLQLEHALSTLILHYVAPLMLHYDFPIQLEFAIKIGNMGNICPATEGWGKNQLPLEELVRGKHMQAGLC